MVYSFKSLQFLVWLIFLTSCQKIVGQEIGAGEIMVTGVNGLVFHDSILTSKVKTTGVVRVTFKDSLTLQPVGANVTIFRMKNVNNISDGNQINFSFFYSRENNLSEIERVLFDKYSVKVDSIYMNGKYQFVGEKRWLYGRRLDISFSFEIEP